MLGLALSFGVAMALAGRMLWRGDPRGLVVLLLVLAGEFEFLLGAPSALLMFGLHSAVGAAYAVGNVPATLSMTPQMVSGYPVIAVALFYPAYRALAPGPTVRRADGTSGASLIGGSRTVPQALGVLVVLEVVAGLTRIAPALKALRDSSADPLFHGYRHVAAVAHAAMAVNSLFDVALLVAGVLLLRARRAGLAVLAWTLAAEFLYYAAVPMSFLLVGAGSPLRHLGPAMAVKMGDFALDVQFLTGFPVIGTVLMLISFGRGRVLGPMRAAASSPEAIEPRAAFEGDPGRGPAGRRLKVIQRVLAGLTLSEAAASLFQLGPFWLKADSQLAARLGVRTVDLAAFWLDAALGLALIFSAVLLWRQNEAALKAISLTIIAEGAVWSFFPFVPGPLLGSYERPSPMVALPFRGGGNLFLGVQLVTGFPVVAAALVILAARYRAILASDGEGRAPDGRPALASWKAMVAIRLLAAVTFLEGAAGLFGVGPQLSSFRVLLRDPPTRLPQFFAAALAAIARHGPHTAYVLFGIDVAFSVLLVACAVLLWLQSRWGLVGLVAVLLAEFAGLVALTILRIPFVAYSMVTPGLGTQIGTGYPFVAALLLVLALRWRRAARNPILRWKPQP